MSDLLRLALEADTKPFPLRADDTPEVQAERRRVLLEAMAPDRTECPVCHRSVIATFGTRRVGSHAYGLRTCQGSGLPLRSRLTPNPVDGATA